MRIVNGFFNLFCGEIHEKYFPNVEYYRDNADETKARYAVELFNNGCLTIDVLIAKVAKHTKDSKENIELILNKYLIFE